MPRTCYTDHPDNPAEQRLSSLIPLEHATSMLFYQKNSVAQRMVHAMKFHRCPELCEIMGRQMGLDMMRQGRFDDIDLLMPVPLHWLRRMQRGYNQSLLLCRGIAEVMPRPISTGNLVRHRYTHKQSQRHATERNANVEGAFRVRKPDALAGHHVLLVDDVLTTGATLAACAKALSAVPGLRISIATLTIAGG